MQLIEIVEMRVADAAEAWAKAGFHPVALHGVGRDGACSCGKPACKGAGKHPVAPGWQRAALDVAELAQELRSSSRPRNLGLRMGAQPSGDRLLAVDDDGGLAAFETEHGELPPTLTLRSGSGGKHRLYRVPAGVAFKNSVRVGGHDLDVRCDGGQIVVTPSLHKSGGRYGVAFERPIADLPASFVELLREKPQPQPTTASIEGWTLGGLRNHQDRMLAYCRRKAEEDRSIEGSNGSAALARWAGAVFWKLGLSEAEGFPLLQEMNRIGANPPWSDAELRHAMASGTKPHARRSEPRGHLLAEWKREDEREAEDRARARQARVAAPPAEDDWNADAYADLAEQGERFDVDSSDEGNESEAAPVDNVRDIKSAKPQATNGKAPSVLRPLADLVPGALEQSKRRQSGAERPIETPWKALNDTLSGGLWPGMHVLCAGSGVGKTALSLQIAGAAASAGTPVGLVALELDEAGLVLRIVGEAAGVGWSRAYTGKVTDAELDKLGVAAKQAGELPVYCDFGDAHGWPSSRLERIAREIRAKHPTGPALIVLDFLQLVSADEGTRTVELRERIGAAAYRARNVAKNYNATLLVISSTARANYGALSAKLEKSGLVVESNRYGKRRAVLFPDQLIGTGKESGELEYSADSVTVLMRPPLTQGAHDPVIDELGERGGKVIVAATVKLRAGPPSWFALAFEQGRFAELPEAVVNSLAARGADQAESSSNDPLHLVREVVRVIQQAQEAGEPLKSKRAICERVSGRTAAVLESIKEALRERYISSSFGPFVVGRVELPAFAQGSALDSECNPAAGDNTTQEEMPF